MKQTKTLKVRDEQNPLLNKITRKEATAAGMKRYYTGKPCKHGHVSERQTSNGTCVECASSKKSEYYKTNQSKRQEHNSRYYKKNEEAIRQVNAEWRNDNPERMAKIRSDYYQKNKPSYLASSRARKKHILMATPPCADMEAIERVYYEAQRLTIETGIPHDVDHIVPLRGEDVCGLHVEWNLRPIPASENRSKANKRMDLQ